MSYVNHVFATKLAGSILGSEGMRIGGVYMMLAEENRGGILMKKEAKFLDFQNN
jgi:hypothetical protein